MREGVHPKQIVLGLGARNHTGQRVYRVVGLKPCGYLQDSGLLELEYSTRCR